MNKITHSLFYAKKGIKISYLCAATWTQSNWTKISPHSSWQLWKMKFAILWSTVKWSCTKKAVFVIVMTLPGIVNDWYCPYWLVSDGRIDDGDSILVESIWQRNVHSRFKYYDRVLGCYGIYKLKLEFYERSEVGRNGIFQGREKKNIIWIKWNEMSYDIYWSRDS